MRVDQVIPLLVFSAYIALSLYFCIAIFRVQYSPTLSQGVDIASLTYRLHRLKSEAESHHIKTADFEESLLERKYWAQWAVGSYRSDRAVADGSLIAPDDVTPRRLSFPSRSVNHTVDIWSNNGLGEYLWQHLLQGRLRPRADGLYSYGERIVGDTKFRFKGGSNVHISHLPDSSENVVLVLNARANSTLSTTLDWLNDLPNIPSIRNVGLVVIGDELCNNTWLSPYLARVSGVSVSSIRFVFLVYDSPLVDDITVFQFPLGVATYRGFPPPMYPDVAVPGRRKYLCNFIGTVYSGSSRDALLSSLYGLMDRHRMYLKPRYEWTVDETADSLNSYIAVLKSSDLTLCPVGLNAESYRIYEAISHGSVPVIEDRATAVDTCDVRAHRLLKNHKAPVIFVKSWSELPALLEEETRLSLAAKEKRRQLLLGWYSRFTRAMAEKFTSTVSEKFLYGPSDDIS